MKTDQEIAALVGLKSHLIRPHRMSDQVMVRVSPFHGDRYQCVPCGDLLSWDPSQGAWCCDSCHFLMSPQKEEELLVSTLLVIRRFVRDTRRRNGTRWPWVRWYKRLRRVLSRS